MSRTIDGVIGRYEYHTSEYDLDGDELDDVCCETMKFHMVEREQPILYIAKFREYSLKCRLNWTGVGVIQNIKYCPFCGKRLPKPLRDKWYNTLKKLGIKDLLKSDIPEEFKDATWWKNKGL